MERFRPCFFGLLAAALTLCAGSVTSAADLPRLVGTVNRVIDGDTIEVQLASGLIRVRLHGIDSPERNQPWGKEAAAAMTQLVLSRRVELEPFEQDRYERFIARVFAENSEVNGELIKQGHAWAYRQYMTKDDAPYCSFEARARQAQKGLWSLKRTEQVPPWIWRKGTRARVAFAHQPTPLSEQACLSQIQKNALITPNVGAAVQYVRSGLQHPFSHCSSETCSHCGDEAVLR